jgi:two-component system chemotaxis sensor kinase CheA
MTTRKHTVLSIDDDPFFKDFYRAILEPKGYRFVSAMDPAAGYAAAKKEKPNLILLDVMLPEKKGFADGFGLLQSLRELSELKDMPIILISALGDDADVRHGMDGGATAYIPKQDLTPHKLLDEIKKYLK